MRALPHGPTITALQLGGKTAPIDQNEALFLTLQTGGIGLIQGRGDDPLIGRGVLLANLLSGAARETARLAALEANSGSNTLPPPCTGLATPCSITAVVTGAHLLDALGVTVVYQDSSAISSPPAYGTYAGNADPTQPGTITLTGATNPNTVYVFVYELL